MIVLLFLIPILCISMSLYVVSLVSYIVMNSFDVLLTSVTAFISIVVSFFVIKIFIRDNEHIAFVMNLDRRSSLIHGYFSFFIMFLFGISLITNSFVHSYNLANLAIGFMFILLFLYVTFESVLKSQKQVLKLVDIDDIDENLDRLVFEDKTNQEYEYYVRKNSIYNVNKDYLCKIGKSSKLIKKIEKEVIDID